jgi:hypothetical protein
MRIRREKIKDLAAQAVVFLRQERGVRLTAKEDVLRVVAGDVILENLQTEDEIEREAEQLLAAHKGEIAQGNLDVEDLRARFKREIAKRRGFRL